MFGARGSSTEWRGRAGGVGVVAVESGVGGGAGGEGIGGGGEDGDVLGEDCSLR